MVPLATLLGLIIQRMAAHGLRLYRLAVVLSTVLPRWPCCCLRVCSKGGAEELLCRAVILWDVLKDTCLVDVLGQRLEGMEVKKKQ